MRNSESLFDVAGIENKLEDMNVKVEVEGFWDNVEQAQKLLKEKRAWKTSWNTSAVCSRSCPISNFS